MLLWYERGESNPHAVKTLEPKSSASTSSATLAYVYLLTKPLQQVGALCHAILPNQP